MASKPSRSSSGGQAELVAVVRDEFRFLEERDDCQVEIKETAWQTVVAYVLERLTFEVELDWREQAAFLLVARTIEGHRPPGYYMYEGRTVRVHLADALADQSQVALIRRATRPSGPQAMQTSIQTLASVLRVSVNELLSSPDQIFER